MKQTLLPALFFFFTAALQSQEYKRVKDSEKINGEQAYILPKAAFLIEVPYIKTTLLRGAGYKDYTKEELKSFETKYGLDVDKYKALESVEKLPSYKIIEDSIKIITKSVPDYSKIFYVDPNKKWYKNQTVSFSYSTDGILSEGESSVENKSFDIVIKSLSGVASIVGSFFIAKGTDTDPKTQYEIEDLKKALEKFEILNTQTNYDIYKDLKAKYEKGYNDIFSNYFYKEKKEAHVVKFLYTPLNQKTTAIGSTTEVALFRFNKDDGKVIFSTGLEDQIVVKDRKFETAGQDSYKLIFEKQPEQQLTYYKERDDIDTGFAYNIPLYVQLKMKGNIDKEKTVYYEAVKIPQFGAVGYSSAKNKKLIFQLDPLTGELKKLTIEGKAVTTDQAGSIAPIVVDAVKLAKGESSATKLENEVKELENIKKKRDLIKELEIQ
jgi:hypothetical protein